MKAKKTFGSICTVIIIVLFLSYALVFLLYGSGCQDNPKHRPIVELLEIPPSRTLTLSQRQLISLEWHSPNRAGARVTAKRVVPGQGVEFDIY